MEQEGLDRSTNFPRYYQLRAEEERRFDEISQRVKVRMEGLDQRKSLRLDRDTSSQRFDQLREEEERRFDET